MNRNNQFTMYQRINMNSQFTMYQSNMNNNLYVFRALLTNLLRFS